MSLEGRTALVTGGGRGIGKAIAERLAREGAKIIVTGRTEGEIEGVAGALGGVAVKHDVTARAAVSEALASLSGRGIDVDALVNNAGAAESAPYDKTPDEIWDRMMAAS